VREEIPMNLYYVQDSDNPTHVLAETWQEAADRWRAFIEEKYGESMDGEEPRGIQLVADGDQDEIDYAAVQSIGIEKGTVHSALMDELHKAEEINCNDVRDSIIRLCDALGLPPRDDGIPF
jgi:hypothetical protein